MKRFAGLRLAVGLLTIIPVQPPETIGRREARAAMLLAPLAVLPVAVLAGLIGWGLVAVGLPGILAGLVAVALLAFGTRAMHLDGLADTTDGLGSGKEADRALEIMRRGDVGPMGTVALILALAMQAVAAAALLERPYGWLQLVVLGCFSRAALLLGCVRGVPAARPDGLGALVAGTVGVPAAVSGWLVGLAAATGAAVLAAQAPWQPADGAVLAALACVWLVQRCVRRLGGVTGDVLGALVEVCATVLLVAATAS